MPRISAKGIVIHNDAVLVLYRNKRGEEYHTFPGGGVEEGEGGEDAATREVVEETSITAKPTKLLYRVVYEDDSEQLYYLCDYVFGEPQLHPDSEEKAETEKCQNVYKPLWLSVSEISSTTLYPTEVRDALIKDLKDGFSDTVKEFFISHHSVAKKGTDSI
jgi:8-oxo-dGTP pyrophosphatase MutT (NUDIX family)